MQHNKSRAKKFLVMMAISFLMIMPISAIAAGSVLSGMEIVSGLRGTILTLRSDNAINCKTFIKAKTVIKIAIPGCVYGLQDFSYSKFEKESPVASIVAAERKDGSGIELTISMRGVIDEIPVIKGKNNDTYILLSKDAGNTFSWKAESVLKPEIKGSNNKVPERSTSTQAVLQGNDEKKSAEKSVCKLIDISMVFREQVCRVNFKFDGIVKKDVHRNRDSLICVFTEVENGLEKTSFELLPSTVYRKVLLTENKNEKTLIARVIIDTAAYQSILNLVFEDSSLFSIMALNKESSYNAFWNAHSGVVWEHELLFVKSYEIDLKKLGERAEKDVAVNLTNGPVFSIGEFYSGSAEKEPGQSEITKNIAEEKITAEESPAARDMPGIIQNAEKTDTIPDLKPNAADKVVINADDVNIRRQPSVSSPAIAKAMRGMSATRHQSTSAWTQITLNGSKGWINSKFIGIPESFAEENPSENVQTVQNVNFQVQKNEGSTNVNQYSVPNDSIAIQKVSQQMTEDIVFRDDGKEGIGNVIRYNQQGRDPFMPLHKDSLLQRGKASIEQILLVGVLIDGNEKVALFEDKRNKKYAVTLRESDAVENGKVLKIFQDRVVFLLTEFGISRSFTLHLKNSNTDQEARVR